MEELECRLVPTINFNPGIDSNGMLKIVGTQGNDEVRVEH
jgi:hypothetical protein